MFGILDAASVPHSCVYPSCEELMRDLNSHAEKEGYKIVKARSHRSRPGAPIVRADLVCERGGRPYRCQATKHKTSTKKTNCPWKAKAVDRKVVGGWVLTVICDHHNYEPGTPEPPTPSEASEADENDAELVDKADGPRPDPETAAALQVAGVSDAVLRLSGDTFHRFKNEYRKMPPPERLGVLAQMQLRIAAIYAVQNEDMLRQRRQDAQNKRHQEIENKKRRLDAEGLQSVKRQRASRLLHADSPLEATHTTPDALQQSTTHIFAPRLEPPPLVPFRPGQTPLAPRPAFHTTFQAYSGPPKRLRAPRTSQPMATQAAQQSSQHQNLPSPPQAPAQQAGPEPAAS